MKTGWMSAPLALAIGCAAAVPAEKPTATSVGPARVEKSSATTTLVPFHGASGFTVLMPPSPLQSERTETTPSGPVYTHLTLVRDEMAKYLVSVSDFPNGSLAHLQRKELLDSLQQSTLRSMNGSLVSSHDLVVAGLPGREFTATDPQGSEVTARLLVGDSRVYTVAGTYPQGTVPAPIRQFLDSFQPPGPATATGSGASVTQAKGSKPSSRASGP